MRKSDESHEVLGYYKLTDEWSVTLPSTFSIEMENEDLVIWKPGFTIWCSVWNIDPMESQKDAFAWIADEQSENAFDVSQRNVDGLLFYRYRLLEETSNYLVASVYCFAFSHSSYIQLGMYFDDENSFEQANKICESLQFTNKQVLH